MKPTSLIIAFACLCMVLLLGAFFGWTFRGPESTLGAPIVTHRSTALKIEQVRKLATLATLHVPISDVQISQMAGYTGGLRMILVVRGDVDIVTDLDQAKFESMDPEAKTATLVLSPPLPDRPRLDHEQTRVYELARSGLWAWLPGQTGEAELTDKAMAEAQRLIGAAANRPDLVHQAQSHAEEVLSRFFDAIGWKVAVRWEAAAKPV